MGVKSTTGCSLIDSDPILTQSWEIIGMVSEKGSSAVSQILTLCRPVEGIKPPSYYHFC